MYKVFTHECKNGDLVLAKRIQLKQNLTHFDYIGPPLAHYYRLQNLDAYFQLATVKLCLKGSCIMKKTVSYGF